MNAGFLSQYFNRVAIKYLSAVEADPVSSNQHEFNGVDNLKEIFGEPIAKHRDKAQFLYFTDADDEPVRDNGLLTWYEARQKAGGREL